MESENKTKTKNFKGETLKIKGAITTVSPVVVYCDRLSSSMGVQEVT